MKKIVMILLIISTSLIAQELIYPDIPRDNITDLIFLNNSTGYFINTGGSIYRTNDGGINWELHKYYTKNSLNVMKFLDNKTGFIAASTYHSSIPQKSYYTIDGGLTWNTSDLFLSDAVDFLPLSNQKLIKSDRQGNIKIINNFFGEWRTVFSTQRFLTTSDGLTEDKPKGYINKFIKLPDNRILAMGNYRDYYYARMISDSVSFILQSENEGEKWDTLWQGSNKLIKSIAFADSNIGWIAGDNLIYKTINGGKNWLPQTIEKINYEALNIFAVDSLNAYLYTNVKNIYFYTFDGGKSWFETKTDIRGNNKFYFINKNKGFIYGYDLYSTNGGHIWNNIRNSINDNIKKIEFVSPKKGFALSDAGIYKTIDGGYSWEAALWAGYPAIFSDFTMLDSLNGFALYEGSLFETVDGWDSYKDSVLILDPYFTYKINFLDDKTGIIFNPEYKMVTISGHSTSNYEFNDFYITEDGGKNWLKKEFVIPEIYTIDQMNFIDKETIICTAYNGLWKSIDKGTTWTKKYDYGFSSSHTFDFYRGKLGYVPLDAARFAYTIDAGENFTERNKESLIEPYDTKFIGTYLGEAERVIEAGYNGAAQINYIYDNYVTSQNIPTYTGQPLNSVSVFFEGNRPHVWIAGDGFNVLYREYELIVSAEKETALPVEYTLNQNYPNPFNPSTVISYSLPKEGFVSLKIYDILGKEVANLVNEQQSAGIYKVNFNAGNFASGIYFYTLEAGGKRFTNKMLLLK